MSPTAAPSGQLTATVLIPAHNEADTIGDLIRACLHQPYPIDEIIVVADSCTDDTALFAVAAGARVIETSFEDKASNQNAALPSIRSDVVIGFDADTIPEPGCIEAMMADINAGYDATCATILPLQPHGFYIRGRRFAYALGRRWWRLCQAKVGRLQVLTGAAYAFRTDVIRTVGGFPRGLISADMDATWAMHAAKYKLGYTARAVALTRDPETFTEYRAQMRRWSSGYFQNLAKYKRQLLHWRSALVVWTALFDLLSLFWAEIVIVYSASTGHTQWVRAVLIWATIRIIVTTALVATVVGAREALLGIGPYWVLNIYNKWLYLCAFGREWLLGRHYTSWTGRHGFRTQITPMTQQHRDGLVIVLCLAGLTAAYTATPIGAGAAMLVLGVAGMLRCWPASPPPPEAPPVLDTSAASVIG